MTVFELKLSGFKFPKNLEADKSNFRMIVDLRYVDAGGSPATAQAVLPGLDTYWECDKNRSGEMNYVRGKDEGKFATFDMNKIEDWDRLILMLPAEKLHSIQVKVFDVNRTDGWDKIRHVMESITKAFFEKAAQVLPGMLGNATEDIKSFLLKKWAGGDAILYKASFTFGDNGTGEHTLSGNYEIRFVVTRKA